MSGNFYIFLSCAENLKLKKEDIKKYLDSVKENKKSDTSIDIIDNILKEDEIEIDTLLNGLFRIDGKEGLYVECRKKPIHIKSAKNDMSLPEDKNEGKKGDPLFNGIYIVNMGKGKIDEVGYWQLGYAYAKNIQIIGYTNNEYTNELDYCSVRAVGEMTSNVYAFMTMIADHLQKLGYSLPNKCYLIDQRDEIERKIWDDQAKAQARLNKTFYKDYGRI